MAADVFLHKKNIILFSIISNSCIQITGKRLNLGQQSFHQFISICTTYFYATQSCHNRKVDFASVELPSKPACLCQFSPLSTYIYKMLSQQHSVHWILKLLNIKKTYSLQYRVRATKSHIQNSTNRFYWDKFIQQTDCPYKPMSCDPI